MNGKTPLYKFIRFTIFPLQTAKNLENWKFSALSLGWFMHYFESKYQTDDYAMQYSFIYERNGALHRMDFSILFSQIR